MFIRNKEVVALGIISILVIVSARKLDNSTQTEAKCPTLSECPYNAEPCSVDEDCNPDSVCCNSPCGNVCTKQLYSGCVTLRRAARRRAKALGVDSKNVPMPRCKSDGSFERIQCSNEIVSSCWCVDEQGFEMPGTRAPAAALVNCTVPKPCGAHTCRMFCEHGFVLDPEGCPRCECSDPCKGVRCPDSLDCQLENLACSDPPCPPVPTCKRARSLNNICPVGDPLRISDTIRPFLCGNDPTKPSCPPMYQCLVQQGHDYGVCCPASLKIQKTGTCPSRDEDFYECGMLCTHDLECPSIQKCCQTDQCGSSCTHPKNITECFHQKALSELLTVSERAGRGYVPSCSKTGEFEPKQCSRNGLVCWCVDQMGVKLKGSMGPAENVNCSTTDSRVRSTGRSIVEKSKNCEILECAAICEYGFKLDDNGCPTCKCDDACEGYMCPEDEECVIVRESSCIDFLCSTLPVCRPKTVYTNPCKFGTPLTDDLSGSPIACDSGDENVCPKEYNCTAVAGSTQSVCCPSQPFGNNSYPSQEMFSADAHPQTMCEYLASFSDSMEGTREGMTLALPPPSCDQEGNYKTTQCYHGDCWCVDNFGTELPGTRGNGNSSRDCAFLRQNSECLDLTCRMGCDYGFVLSEETGCPTCQCRDPCSGVACGENENCQLVEVSCKDHYCPPVPACLPKKIGQCPYLIPATSTSCDFECNSDLACNGTTKCCSNGCGTQCIEPLILTACQHQRHIGQHRAHESGTPAGHVYLPKCGSDGAFESKQCNPATRECWCVDGRGFEISRTRVPISEKLNCSKIKPSLCPVYKCSENCEHGFRLDKNGCRTCECVNPCSEMSCRGEGEICRLVKVECVTDPCPAIPMCLPRKENPCQNGEPLKLGSTEELVACGPDYESCPSSHKCQLSPLGEYAVCCPKPRQVCFEAKDPGHCDDSTISRNVTRYFFNSKVNKCEAFAYSGCQGNHNNFYSEEMCRRVCPVLSQCERLREKNQRAAEKYKKATFTPRCESNTGKWEPVQCLQHVGVCWCVSPSGQALKGTLTRGGEPECNFRQARNRARSRADVNDADVVLEDLMMNLSTFFDETKDDNGEATDESSATWEYPTRSRCEALGSQCDSDGKFLPSQCEQDLCWCVDEAGNQLPNSNTFKKGQNICLHTPIDSVEVILGFRGEYDDVTAIPIVNQLGKIVKNLKGVINNEGIIGDASTDVLYIKFSLIGSNKVDVAYRLEQMMLQQRFPGLVSDITRSRFVHKLGKTEPDAAERVIALEQREIVSQSPVSVVAPYHTALIVIAAASAFVISVLTLLVILYRRKMAAMHNMTSNKIPETEQRFMYNRPIYIELPNEKNDLAKSHVKPPTK